HEIAAELRRARQPVTPEELERAKAVARSRVQLRMDDTRAVSALYGSQVVLDLPLITPEETLARSAAVTIEDVERAAHRVLRDDDLHLAVVGPFEDGAALEAPLQLDD